MLSHAVASLLVVAAACAAAAVAVLAGAFALYALLEPLLGTAGAAGAVALGASFSAGVCAFYLAQRSGESARKAEASQRALADQLQLLVGSVAQRHPVAAVLAAAVGGILAAHRPQLIGDLITAAARFGQRGSSS